MGCSAQCCDQGVQDTGECTPGTWRFYHLDAKSRKTLFPVRNPLEGAQVSLWESPGFDSRDALSHDSRDAPSVLTGTIQPQIIFGLLMNGLEGGIPILQVHPIPWKGARSHSYPPPLQHLPSLGPSRDGWLGGAEGQHHPWGALEVPTWFNSSL